jgi:hypothetical protein
MSDKEFDNTNRGGLWNNKRKEKDTHPDYTGSINVDGKEYWLSAWKKYNVNSGEAFLSLSVKLKEDKPAQRSATHVTDDFLGGPAPAREKVKTPLDIDGDGIPF